jgi:hypothetical protein
MFRRNPDAVAIGVIVLGMFVGGVWPAAAPVGQGMAEAAEMPRIYMISAAEAVQCPFLQLALAPLMNLLAQ